GAAGLRGRGPSAGGGRQPRRRRAAAGRHARRGAADSSGLMLGTPRLHLRVTDSTNQRARELAVRGAPHGTLVTAREQTAGRGRQGRSWEGPPGRALLCSLLLR